MSAFVQCVQKQHGGTTVSQTITTTAGNSVIAVLGFSAPKSGLSITQSAGDTTTATAAENDDAGTSWYTSTRVATNVVGGATTFTFNWTGAADGFLFLVETTPLNASTPLDVFAIEAGTTSTTQAIGPTGALADATEFALAIWNSDGSASSTASVNNSFTIPANGNQAGAGVTNCRAMLAYLDCTTAPSVTYTASVSVTAIGVLAVFRLTPAAGDTLMAQSVM